VLPNAISPQYISCRPCTPWPYMYVLGHIYNTFMTFHTDVCETSSRLMLRNSFYCTYPRRCIDLKNITIHRHVLCVIRESSKRFEIRHRFKNVNHRLFHSGEETFMTCTALYENGKISDATIGVYLESNNRYKSAGLNFLPDRDKRWRGD